MDIKITITDAETENTSVGERFVVPNDGCSYFLYTEFGMIGKYDPRTGVNYMRKKNKEWEVSGAAMRWTIDAAYDCMELTPGQCVTIERQQQYHNAGIGKQKNENKNRYQNT